MDGESLYIPPWSSSISESDFSSRLKSDPDENEDEENPVDYTQDWEQVNISGQTIGIKTSSLQQTAEAFGMLVIYASTLGAKFAPYMEETMALALKNLTFFFDDSVRQSAAM